eukprot:gnl/MRDRNA2_/MRDRNA2_18383_c0_seq1.p1 gnl/MRDRNA2_/MRDRNA2_18383_c0~~gnl/MRDRNA2_/MRDRNA2_18383_c0_seq1.p1  ORF type:complete len:546 (-),score=83.22 gnl/MRDRNA2_/MRDRNA2_18383_c0_seq1:161-1579(-)
MSNATRLLDFAPDGVDTIYDSACEDSLLDAVTSHKKPRGVVIRCLDHRLVENSTSNVMASEDFVDASQWVDRHFSEFPEISNQLAEWVKIRKVWIDDTAIPWNSFPQAVIGVQKEAGAFGRYLVTNIRRQVKKPMLDKFYGPEPSCVRELLFPDLEEFRVMIDPEKKRGKKALKPPKERPLLHKLYESMWPKGTLASIIRTELSRGRGRGKTGRGLLPGRHLALPKKYQWRVDKERSPLILPSAAEMDKQRTLQEMEMRMELRRKLGYAPAPEQPKTISDIPYLPSSDSDASDSEQEARKEGKIKKRRKKDAEDEIRTAHAQKAQDQKAPLQNDQFGKSGSDSEEKPKKPKEKRQRRTVFFGGHVIRTNNEERQSRRSSIPSALLGGKRRGKGRGRGRGADLLEQRRDLLTWVSIFQASSMIVSITAAAVIGLCTGGAVTLMMLRALSSFKANCVMKTSFDSGHCTRSRIFV